MRSPFSDRARVAFLEHEVGRCTRAKLLAPLTYGPITVPAGYVTDGASIPRFCWRLIGHPFDARWIRSALVHDLRCEFKVGTPEETHRMFFDAMGDEGNTGLRRWAMYAAVRWFGPRWPAHESIPVELLAAYLAKIPFDWQLEEPGPRLVVS